MNIENEKLVPLEKVTRVEIIDKDGRVYVNNKAYNVYITFQDNERTLKIFLK